MRIKRLLKWTFALACVSFYSCSGPPYYSKTVKDWKNIKTKDSVLSYSVYLVGDAGGSAESKRKNLTLLKSFSDEDSNSAILFLGDNIYHDGMPVSTKTEERKEVERRMNSQLEVADNYQGEIYFIAGNHDWDYMKEDGYEKVQIQEEYIENYLNRGNTFIPDNGCPGPYHTFLARNILLIAIDSQWWLHKYEKPYGRCGECEAEDEEDMLLQLEDLIRNNQNKHILIVAHHPLMSNGNHGGYYNIMDHFFPLRLIRSNWYLPLPVIGSIYPLYRKFGGVDQDIPHYRYQEFKTELLKIIEQFPNVVYAAGHDHNLQLHEVGEVTHIVSGSGSKINPVKGGGDALYTHKEKGFAVIKYYSNGEAWVEFWTPGKNEKGDLAFRHLLYTRKIGAKESYCSLSAIDYSDSTALVAATRKYDISNFGELLFGSHYRKEWDTPIKVPLLDLRTMEGGLIPYGIGGGKQSVSLKLKNLDEREFVLRSVNKDPSKVVPIDFRNTFIHELVEDQISAQHPYGALVIPRLADATRVLHTNPRVVLIPNDSCLGPYRERFQNTLSIFEEDPDESHENVASLGNSKNIVGTDRMRDKIETDEDNKIDQRNFLRARLIDMLVGDWDRHERQYRWAEIETSDGIVYKAVPEDRDQAFFKFDGVVPYLVSRRWAIRNLKNFDYDFDDLRGLNQTARSIDRRYLTGLSEKDWLEIADSMQVELTDEVIEQAVKDLPPEVYAIHGSEIVSKLKSRRGYLKEAAQRYYEILARYVDVFGTDKKEKFILQRVDNDFTTLSVFHIGKDGDMEEKIYERTFQRKFTKEIRLYGLGDEDAFYLTGDVKKGIKVRIIGGEGEDTLSDLSSVKGKRGVVFYDTQEETFIKERKDVNLELEDRPIVNYPNQDQFFYNYTGPRLTFAYNPDDGFYFGGGIVHRRYKFRATPYGSLQKLMISRAFATGATLIDYSGDFKQIGGDLNLAVDYRMYTPQFVMNFFGFGNESVRIDTADEFYRVRLEEINFTPSLYKEFKRYLVAGLGPKYQYFRVEKNANTFLGERSLDPEFYSSRHYAGAHAYFRLGTRDNEINPTRGIMLTGQGMFNQRLDENEYYVKLASEFSFYITPNIPFQLTFASRIGSAINYGDYEFYQANALGGILGLGGSTGNLRGHVRTRFIGDRSFYHNSEIRTQILQFKTYIFPARIGLLALFDYGRVWERGVKSNVWHYGYGGGLWLSMFNRFVVTGTYSLSEDDKVVNVGVGFLF